MKLVVWQSVLTDHQVCTLTALQARLETPIECVVGCEMLAERRQQGWAVPDVAGLSLHLLPRTGWWRMVLGLLADHPDALHVFCGLWGDRRFLPAVLAARFAGRRIGLMMESFAPVAVSAFGVRSGWRDGLRARVRPLAYGAILRLLRGRLVALLAISPQAEEQYAGLGVPPGLIFPFGYFVPAQAVPRREPSAGPLRPVFVGSLIERKGLHILDQALALCRQRGVALTADVYGPGDWQGRPLASGGLCLRGPLPFGSAQRVIAGYDVLILPSLYDGWGVVVNEALLQGVPVVVSDQVGARVLTEPTGAGLAFKAGSAADLAEILMSLAADPAHLARLRQGAQAIRQRLSPDGAAAYLQSVLRLACGEGAAEPRPLPPWCDGCERTLGVGGRRDGVGWGGTRWDG